MGNQLSEENKSKATTLFRCLDRGNKGYLVLADMQVMRSVSHRFAEKTDIQLMKADKNKDNKVSLDELIAYFIKKNVDSDELNRMCDHLTRRMSSRRVHKTKCMLMMRRLKRRGRVMIMAINAFRGSIYPSSADSYATFLPQIFLRRLAKTDFRCLNSLPIKSSFFGVCAFVDVSGFTALTESLAKHGPKGVEMLCAILDKFFEHLVGVVGSYGGDIIKFAGDALLILWKEERNGASADAGKKKITAAGSKFATIKNPVEVVEKKNSSSKNGDDSGKDNGNDVKAQLALAATACCMELQRELSDYKATEDVTLNIHVGVGAGELTEMILGQQNSAEYIITGQPIKDMGDSEGLSHSKEVVISPLVWDLIGRHHLAKKQRDVMKLYRACHVDSEDKKKAKFVTLRDFSKELWEEKEKLVKKTVRKTELTAYDITRFKSLIPLPIYNTLRSGKNSFQSSMRQVSVLFVNVIGLPLTSERASSNFTVHQAQIMMVMLQKIIRDFRGIVNKLMVDDKGVVLLAMFGLPPYSPEHSALRACLASLMIQTQMESARESMLLQCAMGITYENVFCGVVGSTQRREYTVMGDAVNLAARLMGVGCKRIGDAGGIVMCNDMVKKEVAKILITKSLPPVKLKGKKNPTQVFQILGIQSKKTMMRLGTQGKELVALSTSSIAKMRQKEHNSIRAAFDHILRSPSNEKSGGKTTHCLIVLQGVMGCGKTALLPQIIAICEEKGLSVLSNTEVVIVKGIGKSQAASLKRTANNKPFSGWLRIFTEIHEHHTTRTLRHVSKSRSKKDAIKIKDALKDLLEWRGNVQSDFDLLSDLFEAKAEVEREERAKDNELKSPHEKSPTRMTVEFLMDIFGKADDKLLAETSTEKLKRINQTIKGRVTNLILPNSSDNEKKKAEGLKERVTNAFLEVLAGVSDYFEKSLGKPLILLMEDWHKFDRNSKELLATVCKRVLDDQGVEPLMILMEPLSEIDSMSIIADCLKMDPQTPLVGDIAWMVEGNPLFISLWCSQLMRKGMVDNYGEVNANMDFQSLPMPHAIRHYYVTLFDMFGPTKQGILRLLSQADTDLNPTDICSCLEVDDNKRKSRRNPQIYQNHCESLVRVNVLHRFRKLGKQRRAPKHKRSISKASANILRAAAMSERRRYHQSISVKGEIPCTLVAGGNNSYSYQLESQNFRRVIRAMMLDSQVGSLKKALSKLGTCRKESQNPRSELQSDRISESKTRTFSFQEHKRATSVLSGSFNSPSTVKKRRASIRATELEL
eukprot:jgi/Bigna1/79176/fgenesh1_pg.60_\